MSSFRNLLVRFLPTKYKDYELVASDSLQFRSFTQHYRPSRHAFRRVFTLRNFLLAIPTGLALVLAAVLINGGVPALYADIRAFERKLPQHNVTYSSAEGVKYLAIPGHIWGHGWNNVLQEYLMLSYLAYTTNRSYVFDDYTWSHTAFPYTIYDFALRPARIPLNAFISGPTAGGSISAPFPESSSTSNTDTDSSHHPPRAVHTEFWNTVCPRENRRVINAADVPHDLWGSRRLEWWKSKIEELENTRCLEIDTRQKEIFNFDFFGGQEILDVWPSFSQTPILTQFKWSPLISSAVERNFVTLSDTHDASALPSPSTSTSPSTTASSSDAQSDVYPALLAVHLRRGDFIRHCARLADWGIYFTGLNTLEELPDKWIPFNDTKTSTHEEKKEYYRKRCFPTHEEIVERLHLFRDEHDSFTSHTSSSSPSSSSPSSSATPIHRLRRVYVLSNAWPMWLDGLKHKLIADGWEDVIFGGDLILDKEQRGVDVAVDMSIAERAEVFVGNGFSSLTGNIVMLRTAKGMPAMTNRLL